MSWGMWGQGVMRGWMGDGLKTVDKGKVLQGCMGEVRGGKRGQNLSTSLHTMSLFLRQTFSERTAGSFSPSEVEISSLNIVSDNYSFQK